MSKLVKNAVGRDIPTHIDGIGEILPFKGAKNHLDYLPEVKLADRKIEVSNRSQNKVVSSIRESLEKCGIRNGMMLSFHHHFRQGDFVLCQVIDEVAKMGIKDIGIISSSLTKAHDAIADHIRTGVITRIHTSGVREKFGEVIGDGVLDVPAISRSHGGRVRSIASGQVKIDIAFLGASSADSSGNANGVEGKSLCGSLGYAMTDMLYADKVVVVTDNLISGRISHISIPQVNVDYVVEIECIGDPSKIAVGSTRITKNPIDLKIAYNTATLMRELGIIKNGYSFQTGAGGASLAVAKYVRDIMIAEGIKGSFICGGTTGYLVKMLEEGLFDLMYDVQSFDVAVVDSLKNNPKHIEIAADFYANPYNKGAVVNNLDVVILGALEVDVDFNVNAVVGSDGRFFGAIGGHQDTAFGADVTIIVAPSMRARMPIVRDRVISVTTPGETIDAVVTERGIAINPARKDLLDRLNGTRLPILDIHDLKDKTEKLTGKPRSPKYLEEIVALIEYRDGTIIDAVRKLEGSFE
jgi:citrate lyase subunit alpha/citrate CoA-transferase